ncbi:MAG: hypothetical protein RI973_793 [Bacteroidota bacterium]|jgi:hypothetical protein
MQKTGNLIGWLLALATSLPLAAQHQPVFPGLSGQQLFDSLATAYKPTFQIGQAQSRDTLFGKIDNRNDSLACVYTGFTIWLDPSLDPTQAAFMNNSPNAINTEHTYPQSLGASGLAEGDLHHLYPTRANVNAARGNNPFAEIPDEETEEWYYLGQISGTMPAANKELYSERKDGVFEPREDHKGNVARSMFYFYTMYKAQADQQNSTYFESQRQTLCAWHYLDPVDDREWERTWAIAQYQSTPNPFVLDCTLPERSYCSDFGSICLVAAKERQQAGQAIRLEVSPNPAGAGFTVTCLTDRAGTLVLEFFDWSGKLLERKDVGPLPPGTFSCQWQRSAGMPAGMAVLRARYQTPEGVLVATERMVLLPRD